MRTERTMNESLLYLSRHNVWATKTLLDVCRTLTPEQLTAPATATYGSIIETFNHLVSSDAGYLWSLGGPQTTWIAADQREQEKHPEPWSDTTEYREEVADLDELALRIGETERLWESFFASEEFDAERVSILDVGTYECPAGIVMAQVFHHGSVHREQVCAMLTVFGIEPPDVQPWGFADATGISRFLKGRTS
jgi:uncharacterized damage-inducible protein DinB